MAPIPGFKLQCPHCRAIIVIRNAGLIGREASCPQCKGRIIIVQPNPPETNTPPPAVIRTRSPKPSRRLPLYLALFLGLLAAVGVGLGLYFLPQLTEDPSASIAQNTSLSTPSTRKHPEPAASRASTSKSEEEQPTQTSISEDKGSLPAQPKSLDREADPHPHPKKPVENAAPETPPSPPDTKKPERPEPASPPPAAPAPVDKPVPLPHTFTIQEHFGVAHPRQIIDFPLGYRSSSKTAALRVVGPDGKAVPFQVLSNGRLAVETDLPAHGSRNWKVEAAESAEMPTAPHLVQVVEQKDYYEISNGLTGVRVPRASQRLFAPPAPIQGLLYRDGTWTATGPNLLSQPVRKMEVRFRERGPLQVVAEVSYVLDRPAVTDGKGQHHPGGEGFYRSTIKAEAGQPSILIEEEGDTDLTYSLNCYVGLQPTKARYRSLIGATTVENGREPDGRIYRLGNQRPSMDGLVDLQYSKKQDYPRVPMWNPWLSNGGWYWQLYNDRGGAETNIAGIFNGSASRAIGAAVSGANVSTAPEAVTDLITQIDKAGKIHTVYKSGGDLYYMVFDERLQPGNPQKLGSNLIYPDLMIRRSDDVSVVAFDQLSQKFVQIEGGGAQPFTRHALPLSPSRGEKVHGPDAYQASSPTADFLLAFGEFKGKQAALLFARPKGKEMFTFRQAFDAEGDKQFSRPCFTTLSDGRVVLVCRTRGVAELLVIPQDQLDFGTSPSQHVLYNRHRLINCGAAIDARTGNAYVVNHEGAMVLLAPTKRELAVRSTVTNLRLPIDAHGQGPNRRTLAVDDEGRMLGVYGSHFYLYQDGKWAPFGAGDALNLASPQVRYHPSLGEFVLIGRKEGKLTLYTWKAGESAPRQAQQLTDSERRFSGFTVSLQRGSPDARFFEHVRFAWGFFAGIKGTDLREPHEMQVIGQQTNLHSGINLNKIQRVSGHFPDPPRGYGNLFMERKVIQRIKRRLTTDQSYYQQLYAAEPTSRDLIDLWADPSAQGVKSRETARKIAETAHNILEVLVKGDGIYDFHHHYWMGGVIMQRQGLLIDTLLADRRITGQDRIQLKAVADLYGTILWDNDFVPMFEGHGLSMGSANMPVQQQGYRDFYALFMEGDPVMKPRAEEVARRVSFIVDHILNEDGAEMGCVHYIGASFSPTLNNLLQLRMLGKSDLFREERLTRFADFYMGFLTPRELRFGGERKLISLGDGSTESSELFGTLATGFRTVNPTLSSRLMGAWRANGKTHSGFFGTTLLMIDDEAPGVSPALGSANFPGYYSVLRYGWDTPRETACWFVNGDFYRDHRHDDHGSLVFYALGAPLSLDWGSMYSPHTAGSLMHSMVIPETQLGHAWDKENSPLEGMSPWLKSTQESFLSFANGTLARAHFTGAREMGWQRSVLLLHPDPDQPLLLIRDQLTGPQAKAARVWSMNLMAKGDVEVPGGKVTPPPRSSQQGQLPSAGRVFSLPPGAQRLGFTGQWGVDWDLYVASDTSQQAHIGNWAHNWHPASEQAQFQKAHGRPFEERQHILRIKGEGKLAVLLLPYRHGKKPNDLQVKQEGRNLLVSTGKGTTALSEDGYVYRGTAKKVVAAFTEHPMEGEGVRIAGGAAEVVLEGQRGTLTLHGAKGPRTLKLPEGWKISEGKGVTITVGEAGEWRLDYQGKEGAILLLQRR